MYLIRTMFNILSNALFFLALAQGAVSVPQINPGGPAQFLCGGSGDPPCPSGQLCCGTANGNVCQLAGLECGVLRCGAPNDPPCMMAGILSWKFLL
ncbi:hypothetical protein B0H17DRAFT_1060781 [Mycena rosella]|uniref:Hydrophobin n=1 Tax=Mycena rosella TaxID=1033263 RepID=A0AAD7DK31_MYCRO|nr:hypothetical protein B0H17DRAFT_1060781 [Mycena rosella]